MNIYCFRAKQAHLQLFVPPEFVEYIHMLGNVLHFGPDPEYPPAIVYPPSNHIIRPKKNVK